jgi:hypothetical protein
VGLLPLACWDESSNPVGGMDVYFVGVVFFQLDVPATGRSLVQMSSSEWCVNVCEYVCVCVYVCH